jgi:hypothetical protein
MSVKGDGACQVRFDENIIVTCGASYPPLSRPGRKHVVAGLEAPDWRRQPCQHLFKGRGINLPKAGLS